MKGAYYPTMLKFVSLCQIRDANNKDRREEKETSGL